MVKAGIAILVCSALWWIDFYNPFLDKLGLTYGDALKCLVTNDGACGLATGFAQLAGKTHYHPELFWIGMTVLVIGLAKSALPKKRGD